MNRIALAGVVALSSTTAAFAGGPYAFSVYENAGGADLTGLNISFTVGQSLAGTVDFTFTNNSSGDNSGAGVDDLYFESTAFSSASLSMLSITFESMGVNFEIPASPGSPPGGTNIGFNSVLGSAGRTGGGGNRLGVGELLTLRFNLIGGATVADVENALDLGTFRVAAHIQSLGLDGARSVSAVNVPGPGAFALLGLGGLLATRRRR